MISREPFTNSSLAARKTFGDKKYFEIEITFEKICKFFD